MIKISIGSDHAGFELKKTVETLLVKRKIEVIDFGPLGPDSVDYPDFGQMVAQSVVSKETNRGIVICGTGLGMSIVVNRFPGIRGTLCSDVLSAKMSRQHNDSNLLVLAGRMIGPTLADEIVQTWLDTPFEGGRHQRRIDKIENVHKMKQGEK
jgi:ribose 5-phosphate isomerase B